MVAQAESNARTAIRKQCMSRLLPRRNRAVKKLRSNIESSLDWGDSANLGLLRHTSRVRLNGAPPAPQIKSIGPVNPARMSKELCAFLWHPHRQSHHGTSAQ